MYMRNRSGPRILPWGTPDFTSIRYMDKQNGCAYIITVKTCNEMGTVQILDSGLWIQ